MAEEVKEEAQELSYEEYTKQQELGQAVVLAEGEPDQVMADEQKSVAPKEEPIPELTSEPEAKEEPVKPEEKVVPLAALHEERQRRQERDAELQQQRELNMRLMELLQKPAPELGQTEQRDPNDLVTVAELQAALASAKNNPELFRITIAIYEELERMKHPDYDAVVSKDFQQQVHDTPWLHQRVFGSPNPVAEAYKAAKEQATIAGSMSGAAPSPSPKADVSIGLTAAQLVAQAQKVVNQQRQPLTAGRGGDAAPANPLNLEALLALPSEEYSRLMNSLTEAQKRKLFGG